MNVSPPWRLRFSFRRGYALSPIKIYTPRHGELPVTRHRKNLTLSNEVLQRIVDATTHGTLCADALFTKLYFNLPFAARAGYHDEVDSTGGFAQVHRFSQFVTGRLAKPSDFELNLVVAYNCAAKKSEAGGI